MGIFRTRRRAPLSALGALTPEVPAPAPGRPQVPIFPFKISSPYGAVRRSPADGACGVGTYPCVHPGIDVLGAPGTTVAAPTSGKVVAVASGAGSPYGGYGPWLVEILGDDGKYHLLAHLDPSSRSMAELGDRVTAGDPIGTVSSAWHTHWEVRNKIIPAPGEGNMANNLDPLIWLRGAGGIGTGLVVVSAAILAALLLTRKG